MIYTVVRALNQLIILSTLYLSVIPVLGNMLITNDYRNDIVQTFNEDVHASVEGSDVYVVATFILLPTMVCLSIFKAGKDDSQIRIFTFPHGYKKLPMVTWFICQILLGYSTIVEKDTVEGCFGRGSFFFYKVAFVIVNQLFTMQPHPSVVVDDDNTLYVLMGALSIKTKDGKKLTPEEHDALCKKMAPMRPWLWTKHAEDACSVVNSQINLKNPGPHQAMYQEISPTKQYLISNFRSQTQILHHRHSVVLNVYPNLKVAVVLVFLAISLFVMDFRNFSMNSPLWCVTLAQAVFAHRSAALGTVQPHATALTPVLSVKFDGKKMFSAASDVKKEFANAPVEIATPQWTPPASVELGSKKWLSVPWLGRATNASVQPDMEEICAKPAQETKVRDQDIPIHETGGHNKDSTNNTASGQEPGSRTGTYVERAVEGAGGFLAVVVWWLFTQND